MIKAAGQGYVPAQYSVGTMYSVGRVRPRTVSRLSSGFVRLPSRGMQRRCLSWVYYLDRGVAMNRDYVNSCFLRVAAQGRQQAQSHLQLLYGNAS